ncbi:MAG: threonylcarbamoyl-AMP synthase [bacterium]|nr:threonylcarbamoyl-AMP synthase [bacterium]
MPDVYAVDPQCPDRTIIAKAAHIVKNGGLVIFPTETVYGIGALYGDMQAKQKLFTAKKRPLDKPITIHISHLKYIEQVGCSIPDCARRYIADYWPGPVTLLLPMHTGNGKLGFRLPDHPVALALIDASGGLMLATSANKSGGKSPVTAQEAQEQLGDNADAIIDAGQTGYLGDSIIVDCSAEQPVVIREGVINQSKFVL